MGALSPATEQELRGCLTELEQRRGVLQQQLIVLRGFTPKVAVRAQSETTPLWKRIHADAVRLSRPITLVEASALASGKNAYSMAVAAVRDHQKAFKRVGPGQYRALPLKG
jgi:hypothetical protein